MRNNTKLLLTILLFVSMLAIIFNADAELPTPSAFGQPPYRYYFPIFHTKPGIPASTSYYMTTLNTGYIYNLGCELGRRDLVQPGAQDSVAVLAFGCPRCFENNRFGANLFGFGPASLDDISVAVKHFAAGYYVCSGSDMESNLIIGVGTSNYLCGRDPCDTNSKAKAHGTAWSGMVREINQWLVNQGIFHQVQVFGANDKELGWNTPAWSRNWISGFEQVSGNFFLHFGDAAGCPYEDNPHWGCQGQWTEDDVWYISYGAPSALPLPLIYLTNGVHAKQWASLSRYSVAQHGYRMDFTGVFTQWQACQQFGGCNFIDNTPDQAYQQLSFELNKFPATAQNLRWKTDIRWILQSEITGTGGDSAVHTDDDAHPLQTRSDDFATALQEPKLSAAMESSIVSKQSNFQTMAEMAALSRMQPAAKDTWIPIPIITTEPQPFETGIIANGEMPGRPYGVEITTVWQTQTENGYLQIGSGSAPGDSQRGAIYILLTALGHDSFHSELVLAPEGCGPLIIYEEDVSSIFLRSNEGCQFEFNIRDWTLLPISE